MSLIFSWNFRWFGWWREHGHGADECPSIYDFVNPSLLSPVECGLVVQYLRSGRADGCTSKMSFPCIFTKRRVVGTVCVRTDGVFYWFDDVAYYVEGFNVCVPMNFFRHMVDHNFKIPVLPEDIFKGDYGLQHPPLRDE